MAIDDRETARALIAAAGIRPPEGEIDAMIASYPDLRAAADSLYTKDAACFLPAFFPTDADLEEK
jgi:hypothetical protein